MATKEPKWERVTDVKAFLATKGNRTTGPHQPQHRKRLPWPVCARCGLLYLKNDVTRKAASQMCVTED